jgi:hypothetical protein
MKKITYKSLLALFCLGTLGTQAKENVNANGNKQNGPMTVLANNCVPSTSEIVLDLNNVRATILGAGDFWWNLDEARYEVPKGSGKMSVFAGSIWIGGYSPQGNLKVAAMTYRQTGVDFWPGPIDSREKINVDGALVDNPNFGTTNVEICNDYDKHFVVSFDEVSEFYEECVKVGSTTSIPLNIKNWPGNGVNGEFGGEIFAPFNDINGNGLYEPELCEYPQFNGVQEDSEGNPVTLDCSSKENDLLYGDRTIFWVYNDKGNIHTESQAEAIGVEIRAQAFAYQTNDELNDMTFYNYRIINHATDNLEQTYFAAWVDSDVGYHGDDFVGCDVKRGLGYTYNGDPNDETSIGYGDTPPALGMDFFRGPTADAGDGIDNDKDGCVDCTFQFNDDGSVDTIPDTDPAGAETIIMSKFVYYNNNSDPTTGNPQTGIHFYNLMTGKWLNGQSLTYGGTATDPSNPECDFMYPNDTDPAFPGQPWTEEIAGNQPDDRRLLTSAGPFTLKPGNINVITTGLVWARATSGGPFASVEKMLVADDKAQALFDNCFEVISGPPAPDVNILENNQELILVLDDESTKTIEKFSVSDPRIAFKAANGFYAKDDTYDFEGYLIFQLANSTVTAGDVYDIAKARLVGQSDVKNFRNKFKSQTVDTNGVVTGFVLEEDEENPIDLLTNHIFNQDLNAEVPMEMTLGATNSGIRHLYKFDTDAFTKEKLINGKEYYYMVISYAYNEYMPYQPSVAYTGLSMAVTPNQEGQRLPFLAGRKNIVAYKATPRSSNFDDATGIFGMRVPVTRLQGKGSSGYELEISQESINQAIQNYCVPQLDYITDKSPVNIYVVDPSNVTIANYEFQMIPLKATTKVDIEDANWILIQNPGTETADTVFSNNTISTGVDQIISRWGLAVDINLNVEKPFDEGKESNLAGNNGFISASIKPKNESSRWLDFYKDRNYPDAGNWILSGSDAVRDISIPNSDDEKWIDKYAYSDIRFSSVSGGVVGTSGTPNDDPAFADPKGVYGNILDGSWSPLFMTSPANGYPGYPTFTDVANAKYPENNVHLNSYARNNLKDLFSVKIVFTNDKSLWTRVPVIETGTLHDGESNTRQKNIKNKPSVNKNGQQDGSGNGFSWFPGYAINKHNGNRLNMAFGEDSSQPENNGDDMVWNPTTEVGDIKYSMDSTRNLIQVEGEKLGGKHYVYVFRSGYKGDDEKLNPHYALVQEIIGLQDSSDDKDIKDAVKAKRNLFTFISWTSIPLLRKTKALNSGEISIDINVSQPLSVWKSTSNNAESVCFENPKINYGYPQYTFSTANLPKTKNGKDPNDVVNDDILDEIRVVPNPYYGGSAYETSQNEYAVKILNLPRNSKISIYNTNGTLVRFEDVEKGGVYRWDLKNRNNLSIASGLYLIHISSPVGEKTIKWVGALRGVEIDTF